MRVRVWVGVRGRGRGSSLHHLRGESVRAALEHSRRRVAQEVDLVRVRAGARVRASVRVRV